MAAIVYNDDDGRVEVAVHQQFLRWLLPVNLILSLSIGLILIHSLNLIISLILSLSSSLIPSLST